MASVPSTRAVIAIVALLTAYNPVSNLLLPEGAYVPANLAVTALVVFLAHRTGIHPDILGVDRRRIRIAARIGGLSALLAVAVVGLLAWVPVSRSFFADDRFVGVGVLEMLYEAVIRIPFGTAVSEEILFRGVIFGLLLARTSALRAGIGAALLFGLWHVLPTLATLETNPAGDLFGGPAATTLAVAGGVVTTALAGLGFTWLRLRAAHVLAPIAVHAAINSGSYVAGWLIVRHGWA